MKTASQINKSPIDPQFNPQPSSDQHSTMASPPVTTNPKNSHKKPPQARNKQQGPHTKPVPRSIAHHLHFCRPTVALKLCHQKQISLSSSSFLKFPSSIAIPKRQRRQHNSPSLSTSSAKTLAAPFSSAAPSSYPSLLPAPHAFIPTPMD